METTELSVRALTDRCPFSRVFGPDFNDCAAFTQEEFRALDTQYQPLQPVITCRHLEIGTDAAGSYYPRCALGGIPDRARWAQEVGPDRLRALRALSVEYRKWVSTVMPRAWEAKGRLLAARADGRDTTAPAAELRERVDDLLLAAYDWIDQRGEPITAVGLDTAILKSLVAMATEEWAESPTAGLGYQVPDHVLDKFPPQIQVFIRAGRGEPI